MAKINPKAELVLAKGWATSHLVLAIVIAAVVGFALGHFI